MERFLLYLDDLDDLFGAFGLLRERLRNLLLKLVLAAALVAFGLVGILLAFAEPPLALATAILLFVTLLYRSVTGPHRRHEAA